MSCQMKRVAVPESGLLNTLAMYSPGRNLGNGRATRELGDSFCLAEPETRNDMVRKRASDPATFSLVEARHHNLDTIEVGDPELEDA